MIVNNKEEKQLCREVVGLIVDDEWIDSDTIIVCCCPLYSSSACQTINHLLSFFDNNQLHDIINLQVPLANMIQVLNQHMEWEFFSTYLKKFTYSLNREYKYLLIDTVTTEPHLSSIKSAFRELPIQYKMASLFLEEKCSPIDYSPYIYSEERNGKIVFEWENKLGNGR